MPFFIYLHPDITLCDLTRLVSNAGYRLISMPDGALMLRPHCTQRLPSGARYTRSEETNLHATFARVKASDPSH